MTHNPTSSCNEEFSNCQLFIVICLMKEQRNAERSQSKRDNLSGCVFEITSTFKGVESNGNDLTTTAYAAW